MSRLKESRRYLEERWLPELGVHAPILDIGKRDYTARYREITGAAAYVAVDRDPEVGADLVADICSPSFVEAARALYPAYGAILCNGVLGHGVDTEAQLRAAMTHFAAILRPGGLLLIGWNEWEITRAQLCGLLTSLGLRNDPIEGSLVHEPPETPGYEHLRHFYTCWRKP